ncbi:DEAD/DEAH box helicase [Candidatus Dependentiae bacterium]|nr:DEAD/DEAH box helicase [Candidatus Dependentiae bacterium]
MTFALWAIGSNGIQAVATIIADFSLDQSKVQPITISLGLPVTATAAIVPPTTIRAATDTAVKIAIQDIPAIQLTMHQFMALFATSADNNRTNTISYTVGSSWQWWQALLQEVQLLVQHHWITPTIEQATAGNMIVQWQLLLPYAHAAYCEQLLHALPAHAVQQPLSHAHLLALCNHVANTIVRKKLQPITAFDQALTATELQICRALQQQSTIAQTPAASLLAENLQHWRDHIVQQLTMQQEREWRLVLIITHHPTIGWQLTIAAQWTADPTITIPFMQLHQLLQQDFVPAKTLADELPTLLQTVQQLQKKFTWITTTTTVITTANVQELLAAQKKLTSLAIALVHPPITHKRLEAIIDTKVQGTIGINAIIAYQWQLAIDQIALTPQEFARLVETDNGYLLRNGEFIVIDPDTKRHARHYQQQENRRQVQMIELIKMVITHQLHGIPIASIQLPPVVEKSITALTHPDTLDYQAPPLTGITLRPYQLIGYRWLMHLRAVQLGALLADDMGLGKTIQIIALMVATKPQWQGNWLIICPVSVMHVWQAHIARYAPTMKLLLLHGTNRDTTAITMYDIILTTYATVARSPALAMHLFDTIIVDEAQALKNPTTAQTIAIKQLQAYHRIALTGTPIENKLEELWSIIDFCNKGYLGTLSSFSKQYAEPIAVHHDQQAIQELQRLIAPFLLRRTKDDPTVIQGLPQKREFIIQCTLSPHQAALYQQVVNELLSQAATASPGASTVLTTITRLKQICNDPALITKTGHLDPNSGKLKVLVPLLKTLISQQRKILLFTQFATYASLLTTHLEEQCGIPTLCMTGASTAAERQRLLQQFATGNAQLLIASLKTGGVGLTITCATAVIHIDRWWNPAVEQQATDRTYRIGQEQDIDVYNIQTVGTIEEKIEQLLAAKQAITSMVQATMSKTITQLSLQELTELLTLRPE